MISFVPVNQTTSSKNNVCILNYAIHFCLKSVWLCRHNVCHLYYMFYINCHSNNNVKEKKNICHNSLRLIVNRRQKAQFVSLLNKNKDSVHIFWHKNQQRLLNRNCLYYDYECHIKLAVHLWTGMPTWVSINQVEWAKLVLLTILTTPQTYHTQQTKLTSQVNCSRPYKCTNKTQEYPEGDG